MKRIHIITNPSSGKQEGERLVSELIDELTNRGCIVSKFLTEKKMDAHDEAMRTEDMEIDCIVASGGDGTANEVVQGLAKLKKRAPLALYPQGTVNDFATFLQIPTDPVEFTDLLVQGHKKSVDIGQIDDEYFLNVAAFGNVSKIGHEVDSDKKTAMGRFAYLLEGVKKVPSLMTDPLILRVTIDDQAPIEEDFLIVAVTNSPSVGGFKNFAPKAVLSDGRLDVVGIRKTNIVSLGQIMIGLSAGEHISHEDVMYFQAKEIKIQSEGSVAIDIDGEEAGSLPATVRVLPGHLEMLIP